MLHWNESDYEFKCIGFQELLSNLIEKKEGYFLGMGGISITRRFQSGIKIKVLMTYFY